MGCNNRLHVLQCMAGHTVTWWPHTFIQWKWMESMFPRDTSISAYSFKKLFVYCIKIHSLVFLLSILHIKLITVILNPATWNKVLTEPMSPTLRTSFLSVSISKTFHNLLQSSRCKSLLIIYVDSFERHPFNYHQKRFTVTSYKWNSLHNDMQHEQHACLTTLLNI